MGGTPRGMPANTYHTSPVSSRSAELQLPLNLVAVIISYLDNVADLARVCRASRVLYYMALPTLYEKVTLHAYPELRYVDGRPEGYGSGSPFSMALNGLVTRNVADLVRHLRLWGEWKEWDIEEYSKGRVPDNIMMLNIVVRAALDKMPKLQSFSWELNTKPLKTIYQGLMARPNLTSLSIRFPNTPRVPRPIIVIPPLPNLRKFKATNIDPLCYPDDISVMLLHARKLTTLILHWSPRMRAEREPSTNLQTYFGKLLNASPKTVIGVKTVGFYNLYAPNDVYIGEFFDVERVESISFINCVGNDPATAFMDNTWKHHEYPKKEPKGTRVLRTDAVDEHGALVILQSKSLEKLYLVSNRRGTTFPSPLPTSTPSSVTANGTAADPPTPTLTPSSSPTASILEAQSLWRTYYSSIITHGPRLRHLLLSNKWSLGAEDLAAVVHACPNLEQLGLALEANNLQYMKFLIPFLKRLEALRVLRNPFAEEGVVGAGAGTGGNGEGGKVVHSLDAISEDLENAGAQCGLWRPGYDRLRYMGIGDKVFRIGRPFEVELVDAEGRVGRHLRREVVRVDVKEVDNIAIWRCDTGEVVDDE